MTLVKCQGNSTIIVLKLINCGTFCTNFSTRLQLWLLRSHSLENILCILEEGKRKKIKTKAILVCQVLLYSKLNRNLCLPNYHRSLRKNFRLVRCAMFQKIVIYLRIPPFLFLVNECFQPICHGHPHVQLRKLDKTIKSSNWRSNKLSKWILLHSVRVLEGINSAHLLQCHRA